MKKAAEVKYPHSASLFQFCRRVLDHKFGGLRVIDQDVGQILGFDPADCSHWKKGKKNVRSIQAMRLIADHLGVDERLVAEVAAGELEDAEAFHEYSGYGAFHLDNKIIETAKKDLYRQHAALWSKDKEAEFREIFSLNEAAIERAVADIHARINFLEAPLYLPEIAGAYPQIKLRPTAETAPDLAQKDLVQVQRDGTQTTISYPAGLEMRPYVRYRIAKGIALHFLDTLELAPRLPQDLSSVENHELYRHLLDVQSNIFAANLLAPAALIRREIANVNVSKDIVAQLAETIWVSKAFINRRLKELLKQDSL